MMSLVQQLQADALKPSVNVDTLLRRAKVIAVKLDLPELLTWVERELNGYQVGDEVPTYRQLTGQLRGFNPNYGWQLLIFSSPTDQEIVSAPRRVDTVHGHTVRHGQG